MTQTNLGFTGTLASTDWAKHSALLLGGGRCIGGPSEIRVSQVAGSRAVSISAGRIGGDGVVTISDAAEQKALPTPANGQWFLLVNQRVWATKVSTFEIRNGALTSATFGFLPPTDYPASLETNPGTKADVPVAWLWANSSSTTVYIFPILQPSALSYPRRGPATLRDQVISAITSNAPTPYRWQWVQQNAPRWFNTDTGLQEFYRVSPDSATADWRAPDYDSGWSLLPAFSGGYGPAAGQTPEVRAHGWPLNVELHGQANRNTGNNVGLGDRLATFPVGQRPKQLAYFTCASSAGVTVMLKIDAGGDLVVYRITGGTATYVILDGIFWIADA